MLDEVLKARRRDQDDAMNQHLREGQLDFGNHVISLCPSDFLPHVLNL